MVEMTDLTHVLSFREALRACTACELHVTCKGPVPWRGDLNPTFAVLGMSPGANEDLRGEPFVGDAGQFLENILAQHSIDPSTVTYLNSVQCFPPGHKLTTHHINICRKWARGQIAIINPTYLIVLGQVAIESVCGDTPWAKVAHLHGRPLFWPTPPLPARPKLWVTYHPSWAMRSPRNEQVMVDDLTTFRSFLDNGETWPTSCVFCQDEFFTWDEDGWGVPLCQRHERKGMTSGHLRDLQPAGGRHQEAWLLSRRSRVGRGESEGWDELAEG